MKNLTMSDIKNISFGLQKCSGVTSSVCISTTYKARPTCGSSGAIYMSGSLYYYYCYQSPAPEINDMHVLAQKYYCDTGDSFYFEISEINGNGKVGVGTGSSNYNYASCTG